MDTHQKLPERAAAFVRGRFGITTLLNLSAVLVGLLAGGAALILKLCVHTLERFTEGLASHSGPVSASLPWMTDILHFIAPALGIGLTILFVRFVVRDDLGHGVSKVMASLSVGNAELPAHSPWSNVIACSLTVGFGGSVGMEAPIIAAGSGIGSAVARGAGMDARMKSVLVGCGAAAAVAGVFRAPITGVMIALEILLVDVSSYTLMPLLISSVTGALLAMVVWAGRVEFSFVVTNGFHFAMIPWYLPLGLLCGLLSLFMVRSVRFIEQAARKAGPVVAYLAGCAALCALALLVSPLFGEGYDAMRALLSSAPEPGSLVGPSGTAVFEGGLIRPSVTSGWLFVLVLLAVPFLKVVTTASTTAAGGVGGLFAPSLVIGCTFGYACAAAASLLGIGPVAGSMSVQNFALAAMAGVLAGVMQAPLTAIFLIAEITNGYQLLVPLIITASVSFITIRAFEKYSVYARPLALAGKHLTRRADVRALRKMRLADFVREVPVLRPSSTLADVRAASEGTASGVLPVLEGGRVSGLISLADARPALFDPDKDRLLVAGDLADRPLVVFSPETTVEEALECFRYAAVDSLPFADASGFKGLVHRRELLAAFQAAVTDICRSEES